MSSGVRNETDTYSSSYMLLYFSFFIVFVAFASRVREGNAVRPAVKEHREAFVHRACAVRLSIFVSRVFDCIFVCQLLQLSHFYNDLNLFLALLALDCSSSHIYMVRCLYNNDICIHI